MAILTNQRHERFAQLVATGESGAGAYGEVYGRKGAVADANASRLLRNAKVRARIAELQQKAAEKAVLTLARKRELLREMAEGERPTKRIEDADGPTDVYEAVKAIELDAKLAGEFKEKVEVTMDALTEALLAIRKDRR